MDLRTAFSAAVCALALAACGGTSDGGTSPTGGLAAGTWVWDGGNAPWSDPESGIQYASMELELRGGSAPSFELRAVWGPGTPGKECRGDVRTGYWDASASAGQLLLTTTSEGEICEPEKKPEEIWRLDPVRIRGVTGSSFSACFGECGSSRNWLEFAKTR